MEPFVAAGTSALIKAADYAKNLKTHPRLIPIIEQGSEATKVCAEYLQKQDPNIIGYFVIAGVLVIISAACTKCFSRKKKKKQDKKIKAKFEEKTLVSRMKNKEQRLKPKQNKKKSKVNDIEQKQWVKIKTDKPGITNGKEKMPNKAVPEKKKESDTNASKVIKKTKTAISSDKSENEVSVVLPKSITTSNSIEQVPEKQNKPEKIIEKVKTAKPKEISVPYKIKASDKMSNKADNSALVESKKVESKKKEKKHKNIVKVTQTDEDIYAKDLALAEALAKEEAILHSHPKNSVRNGSAHQNEENEWETVCYRKPRKNKSQNKKDKIAENENPATDGAKDQELP
mmetsp:Transcript_7496/g.11209  ORF Transcript_7496/g.11209 Transcript_7496/m.11209 type:complete len:343 (-) Transcript_7496:3-1031(-)